MSCEPVRRGFTAARSGYFGHGGDMDQAITIRTMVFPRRYAIVSAKPAQASSLDA